MKKQILLILLFPVFATNAQFTASVNGSLIDTATREPVSQATISILKKTDSSLVNYALSSVNGSFQIKDLSTGEFILSISALGYHSKKIQFSVLSAGEQLKLERINLQPNYKTLSEATVTDYSPVKIKDDSISFKLDHFKTSPGATLEDALKKIPGIQVQKDGSIKAMGETVQKLYVDGKEFFSNDPSVAARNLTADMIDQVQVFDDMSEQAKFTRIDDGSRSKALNIRLKKDRKKGSFGKINSSLGTNKRYEHGLSWNRFNDVQKISVIAGTSNTNKQCFNTGTATANTTFSNGNAMAVKTANSGGSNSINTSSSVGFNYNDRWSDKIEFQASYQFSNNKTDQQLNNYKKYFYPADSSSENSRDLLSVNKNTMHRLNSRIQFSLDSMQSFLFTLNSSFQKGTSNAMDTMFGLAWGSRPYLALLGSSEQNDRKNYINYNSELLYRLKFRKPGRTFTLGWRNNFGKNNIDNNFHSRISNYDVNGVLLTLIDPDQQTDYNVDSRSNGINASFTNAAGKNKIIEVNYSINSSTSISDKKTFDYNSTTSLYDLVNLSQTNYFNYNSQSTRLGINYRGIEKRFNYQLGTSIQYTDSRNRSIQSQLLKDTIIRQKLRNIFPTAAFNYSFNKNSNLRLAYRGRSNMPSVMQLQDVTDLSNPLFTRIGNPLLKQEFMHNLSMNYNHYHIRSGLFLNAGLSYNSTSNKIINSLDSAGFAVMIIKPVNTNGYHNASAMFGIGLPFKKIRGSNISYNLMSFYSNDPAMVFKKKYFTKMLMIEQSLGFNYVLKQLEFNLNTGLLYNYVGYEVQQNKNSFFRFSWSADFKYQFKNDIYFATSLDQVNHTGRTPGFNAEILLWNAAIAKKFLKDRSAEIKFTAYDIFRQDKGINRVTNENYIEDSRYMVTPGFFIIGFTYNFRKSEKKTEQPKQPMMYFSN